MTWWSESEEDGQSYIPKRRKLAQSSANSEGMARIHMPSVQAGFRANNQLHKHVRNDCWATKNEQKYPDEWTPAPKDYVRRGLDPANSEPG
jgi:hypothetical protein